MTILSSIAQEESHNISQNSTWGIRKRMKDGVALVNCNRFLGYDKDENGKLVINPEEAKVVKRIFTEYLGGKGCTKIAKELERDGVKTGAGQTKWCDTTIRGILANEKYYGELLLQKTITVDYLTHKRVDNKDIAPMYLVDNNHQAIIPKEMWEQAQAERERRFKLTAGKNSNKAKYTQRYPLSGKLICGNCGETLKRRHWNSGTLSERIVWQCITYIQKQASFCPTKGVGEATVQAAFVETYNRLIQNKSQFFNDFLKIIGKTLESSVKKSDYTKICKRIKTLETEISELVTMKLQKQIDDVYYNKEYQKRVLETRDLEHQRDCLTDSQVSAADFKARMEQIQSVIHGNSNPLTEFDPYLFETLIQKVIVHSPVDFTFVFVNGVEMRIDATKYSDGRKYKNRKY